MVHECGGGSTHAVAARIRSKIENNDDEQLKEHKRAGGNCLLALQHSCLIILILVCLSECKVRFWSPSNSALNLSGGLPLL